MGFRYYLRDMWTGGLALAVAALAYDALLWRLRRADRAFPSTDPTESTWWFGYARDLGNLVGVGLYAAGFIILGFPGPIAVLAGALLAAATYSLDYLFARALGLPGAAVALGVAAVGLALATAATHDLLLRGLERVMRWLF
jgi:hypothetical protein